MRCRFWGRLNAGLGASWHALGLLALSHILFRGAGPGARPDDIGGNGTFGSICAMMRWKEPSRPDI